MSNVKQKKWNNCSKTDEAMKCTYLKRAQQSTLIEMKYIIYNMQAIFWNEWKLAAALITGNLWRADNSAAIYTPPSSLRRVASGCHVLSVI